MTLFPLKLNSIVAKVGGNVSLIINNKEACKLANELAELTDLSITDVVLNALRNERRIIVQEKRATNADELMTIGARCASHLSGSSTAMEHSDMLYDEHGIPN